MSSPFTVCYGIVLGRMQPLHLGHLEYLDAARARCRRLVIGVTNPNIARLVEDAADAKRSLPENNPFSYFERCELIQTALMERGWDATSFVVVPADLHDLPGLAAYLPPPSIARVYVTVYDAWGDRKAAMMSGLGYHVDVLWRRSMSERIASGTEVREAMRRGFAWRHLVPPAVSDYLDQNGLTAALARGVR